MATPRGWTTWQADARAGTRERNMGGAEGSGWRGRQAGQVNAWPPLVYRPPAPAWTQGMRRGGSRESHGRSAGERGLGVRRCRVGRRTRRRRDHRGKGARAPRSSSGAGEGRVLRLPARRGARARPRCHHLPLAPCAASRRCQEGWAAARPQRRGPAGRPGGCWRRLLKGCGAALSRGVS